MGLAHALSSIVLKPLVDGVCHSLGVGAAAEASSQAADFLYSRFCDKTTELFEALDAANDRAWKSLEIALAGESFWTVLSDRTDKGFREQIRVFLDTVPLPAEVEKGNFRKLCLDDLRAAREDGLLDGNVEPRRLSEEVGAFARYTDPHAVIEHQRGIVLAVVGEVRGQGYRHLAHLLGVMDVEESLLLHAFQHFLSRETERRPRLKRFLDDLRWQRLESGLGKGFDALDDVLARHGQHLLHLLAEFSALRSEAREHYLDLKDELKRLDDQQARANEELYRKVEQALKDNLRQANREVRFGDSLVLRSDGEYQLVKQLIARYRQLPAAERRRAPALMNAIGKLEVLSGELGDAQQSFREVAAIAPSQAARAEAHFNAYQAALQSGNYAVALAELHEAVKLDARRHAPFPVDRYEPISILGAGGFGVAFLCEHRQLATKVVVKALMADQLAADVDDVFREAQILDQIEHACIIRLRECGYTDPASKERPYFLLNYFEGGTLESHVASTQALTASEAVPLARLIAEGLQAAHERGVLHRDVKPANVLVRKAADAWQVKLIDFGLAVKHRSLRSTVSNAADPTKSVLVRSIAGTLDYAAPEQMGKRSEPVAAYSDVFGFGKTLCYALFKTPNPGPKHWRALGNDMLVDLLGACIEEDPRARPATFADVLKDLGGSAKAGVPAAPPMPKPMTAVRVPVPAPPPLPRSGAREEPAVVKLVEPSGLPVVIPRGKHRPPPLPDDREEPIVLQVDLTQDLREYRRTTKRLGTAGERSFLEAWAGKRLSDWQTAATQGNAAGEFLLGLCAEHGVGAPRDEAGAVARYRKAADQGLPEAQFNLGGLYEMGRGVGANRAEAMRWFQKAAEKGHAGAQFTLAFMCQSGKGAERDLSRAVLWYQRAADQGHAVAQNNLGKLYAKGLGVTQSDVLARSWYEKAADQGFADAQNNLGVMLATGQGGPQDDAGAARWYRKAAEQGHVAAQNNLGWMCAQGRGQPRDDRAAVEWYRKAAEQGSAAAQLNLARMLAAGKGAARDEAEALRWFLKSAELGNQDARFQTGVCFAEGRGTMRDDAEAARWLKLAAEQGHAEAQSYLALLHKHGRGVSADDAEAARLYRAAADKGDPVAQNNLGRLYAEGRGVPRDDGEAVRLYRLAANQKLAEAQNNLGTMYAEGRGVVRDDAEAARCYRLAAEQGDPEGQYNLGLMYELGRGLPKDRTQAFFWFQKAARQGHEGARQKMPEWMTWVNRLFGG